MADKIVQYLSAKVEYSEYFYTASMLTLTGIYKLRTICRYLMNYVECFLINVMMDKRIRCVEYYKNVYTADLEYSRMLLTVGIYEK